MRYAIIIQTGTGDFGPKSGWDELHETRDAANAAALRAERNSGWSAKVISLTEEEIIEYGWGN